MKRAWLSSFVLVALAEVATAPAQARRPESTTSSSGAVARAATPTQASRAANAAPRNGTKSGGTSASPSKAGVKRAAAKSSAAPKVAKQSKRKRTCYARPVQLVRVRGEQVEPHELSLTLCNGAPNLQVLDELSIIARPRDVERPSAAELRAYRQRPVAKGKVAKKNRHKFRDPAFVTARVMRVNRGLLARLQKVANRYPGKIIEVISGYRPDARVTSRHHHGRALDLRVVGVSREQLVTFLRGFDDTGVGYYPNSYFVHMDVRDEKGYWVDRSGPGEPADYGPWPVKKQPLDDEREQIVKGAIAALTALDRPSFQAPDQRTAKVTRVVKSTPVARPEQEPDDMSMDELQRVRAEARQALDRL